MNREQKRKAQSALRKKGYSEKQIESYFIIKERKEQAGKYAEGDRVQLDIQKLISHPNWPRMRPEYREWVLAHKGQTLTVQYDPKRKDKPSLVCLEEDETIPKWLFFVGDLKAVN